MNRADGSTGKSSQPSETTRRALRVLVVEDERDARITLLELLRSEGYEARAVGSSKEMWSIISEFGPDLCLVDIGLPERSGYDIAREMTRLYGEARPKLVAVTGWTKPSDRILARIAGFDRHVAKPYDPPALLALVADIATTVDR